MKLRIKGNSIRLRLTQSEVAALGKTGQVSESLDFGSGGQLAYVLVASETANKLSATFANGCLQVSVPTSEARDWIDSETIGLEEKDTLPAILIEKDFACMTERPGEDESDMFPNPGTTACVSA